MDELLNESDKGRLLVFRNIAVEMPNGGIKLIHLSGSQLPCWEPAGTVHEKQDKKGGIVHGNYHSKGRTTGPDGEPVRLKAFVDRYNVNGIHDRNPSYEDAKQVPRKMYGVLRCHDKISQRGGSIISIGNSWVGLRGTRERDGRRKNAPSNQSEYVTVESPN